MNPLSFGGLVAVLAGVYLLVAGIIGAVEAATTIREDAVASGVVGESIAIEGADEKLTVYLDLDGVSNSLTQESIVSDTRCQVTAEGFRDSFSGSVQGVSTTIGDLSSVGTFTLPEGFGRLECAGSSAGRPMIVSPKGGGAVFAAVLETIGGAVLAGLGATVLVVGLLRRRRRSAVQQGVGLPR